MNVSGSVRGLKVCSVCGSVRRLNACLWVS